MSVVSRAQLEASLSELCAHVENPIAGILGPRSEGWQLGGDLAVFVGGGRAALLQLAHPMVAHAIDHHSQTRADISGRFQRTFHNVFAMVFGDLPAALRAARRVHSVHERITGTFAERHGAFAAGTRYAANDVVALRWVHATLVDTTLVVREHLDGPLPRARADRYVVELNRFAALFGIPRDLLPSSRADHDAYMADMVASDQLAITPAAREMAHFLVGRNATQAPLGRLAEIVTAELLPPHLTHAFELRSSPRLAIAAMRSFAAIYSRLPSAMVRLPAHAEAIARLGGTPAPTWSAWTEKKLFGLATRLTK
ncbi:MAG TPA: oxygenase MpaB family protein [Kofleriaceae bacterium]